MASRSQVHSAELVSILQQLLLSDNDAVQNAQSLLKKFMKQPDSLVALSTVLTADLDDGVRQMAATLLRQRITKSWIRVGAEARQFIKQVLVTTVINDKAYVSYARHSTACVRPWQPRDQYLTACDSVDLNSDLMDNRRSVRQAIARVISIVAKHEVPNNEWPDFMAWLGSCTSNNDVQVREVFETVPTGASGVGSNQHRVARNGEPTFVLYFC
jgi:hypothetical protein